jgi:hypothetical protein
MTIAIIVAIILATDAVVVFAIIRSITEPLRTLARQFPPTTPAPDAVRRGFQSFSFGLVNAGWSMHVAVDEQSLHLSPNRIMRLFGIPPLSIPWTHIRVIKRGRWYTTVRLEGDRERLEVKGPNWCLSLAA